MSPPSWRPSPTSSAATAAERLGLLRDVTGAAPVGREYRRLRRAPLQVRQRPRGRHLRRRVFARRQNLTIYLNYGYERHTDLLQRIGRHSLGKACLYLKRLDGAGDTDTVDSA